MLNVTPIKIPVTFITEIEKSMLKNIYKHKRPGTATDKRYWANRATLEASQYPTSNYTTEP
jgi:hypothetical protein